MSRKNKNINQKVIIKGVDFINPLTGIRPGISRDEIGFIWSKNSRLKEKREFESDIVLISFSDLLANMSTSLVPLTVSIIENQFLSYLGCELSELALAFVTKTNAFHKMILNYVTNQYYIKFNKKTKEYSILNTLPSHKNMGDDELVIKFYELKINNTKFIIFDYGWKSFESSISPSILLLERSKIDNFIEKLPEEFNYYEY